MNNDEKVLKLEQFKDLLIQYGSARGEDRTRLRTALNQGKMWVRREVVEARCFRTMTISPPPAVGGLILQSIDPFDMLFERPYGVSLIPAVKDMVEQTIGVLQTTREPDEEETTRPSVAKDTVKNYAFIAMSMNASDPSLEDVLDSIKEAAFRCGIQAERVDEPQSNDRITDRILESIRKAEYVIVDVTYSRPNVFFEAGYAHGIGKIPIYIAKEGTELEFDLKDYPAIFYKNFKQLKLDIEKRLRGLAKG